MDKKILIIEDEEFLLDALLIKLKEKGFSVVSTIKEKEVFEILKENQIALILLDLVLPNIDGLDFLKKIKLNNKTKNIPVIILSNLGQKTEIREGLNLGAEEYIVKTSITLDRIVNRVSKYVNKK